jgi:transposase-like protein
MRRYEGRSIKEIARLLGVSKSSISLWVRDIELSDQQHAALRARNGLHERQRLANAAMRAKARIRRVAAQDDGRRRVRQADKLYVIGCMLYWAEGSRNRNKLVFTNSDPEMVRVFVNFLRCAFGIPANRIRLTCNLFADHTERQRQIEDFWLEVAGLQRGSLCKSTVNHYSPYTKKKRTNKLPYGTCRVVINSTELAQTIYGSIQELAGFDRPEWLDMAP